MDIFDGEDMVFPFESVTGLERGYSSTQVTFWSLDQGFQHTMLKLYFFFRTNKLKAIQNHLIPCFDDKSETKISIS